MSAPECIKRIQSNEIGLKTARLFSQSTFITANVLLRKSGCLWLIFRILTQIQKILSKLKQSFGFQIRKKLLVIRPFKTRIDV
ncbi:hypothetical protein ACS86_00265 [Vibrio alginolyticus]|nr:hypothetical protein ACS86_00265 [Vibrio alginolyticus]